jgi:hypothetical protein
LSAVTVLCPDDPVVALYAGFPFYRRAGKQISIVHTAQEALRDKGDTLILLRWYGGANADANPQKLEELSRFRENFRRVVFFDTDDSANSNLFFVLPYVDRYWKKQLYKDRSEYLKSRFGNRLFSEFYHERFGVTENDLRYPSFGPSDGINKLRLAWNLGIGSYPVRHRNEKISEILSRSMGPRAAVFPFHWPRKIQGLKTREKVCQARFVSTGYTPTIGYQRELFGNLLKGRRDVLLGLTDRQSYTREMSRVAAVLSPFGWGEVCFRDFEAVLNASILIKPDMGHLETWPDVYKPGETFVAVAWDGHDLQDKIEETLGLSVVAKNRLTEAAWDAWAAALGGVNRRLEELLEDLG